MRSGSKTPKDIDEYLSKLPVNVRGTLQKVRASIHKAAPKAEEGISYQIPTFRHDGILVCFAAFKKHCSFFPASYKVMAEHKAELSKYDTSGGTIRFDLDKPLPGRLITSIVKARVRENEEKKARKELVPKKR